MIATEILSSFAPAMLTNPQPLDLDNFAEYHLDLTLSFADLSHNESILGMMIFRDCSIPLYDKDKGLARYYDVPGKTAMIDNSLLADHKTNRARFTIAHECSHWILHQPENCHVDYQDKPYSNDSGMTEDRAIVCRKARSYHPRSAQKTAADWR